MFSSISTSISSWLRSFFSSAKGRLFALGPISTDWLTAPLHKLMLVGGLTAIGLVINPPVRAVLPGEVALRISRLTGEMKLFHEGAALCVPFVHELRRYSLRDQVTHLSRSETASATEPFQSIEGLRLGMRVTVRWALDPDRILASARRLPDNVGTDLIEPATDEVLRRSLARSTVREIFAGKRMEIEEQALKEVRAALEPEGIQLKALSLGAVDLPDEYRSGLQALLTDEIAVDRTKQTLALKESQLHQSELESKSEKARREINAEAAASEEMIAARAHADAMKHVLPLKEKEIEQRRLEAEGRAVEKKRDAQSSAEARMIEAGAEANARRQLAEADAYKIDVTGKSQSAQYARDAEVLTRNPLLVQKAFAEKLSEHLQVVVAPPSMGGFFAANLLGGNQAAHAQTQAGSEVAHAAPAANDDVEEGTLASGAEK